MAFKDPANALELAIEYGQACEVLDSRGCQVTLKQLEEEIKEYDTGKEKEEMYKYAVDIHTDGSCRGNRGPGGYAAIIVYHGKEKTVRGFDASSTTNQRMELKAVVEAVKALDKPCEVTVHTDSQYLCTCSKHNKEWFERIDRPNQDLWFELITAGLSGKHHIKFVKVQGHSGDYYNERCDKIAKEQSKKACHELLRLMKE